MLFPCPGLIHIFQYIYPKQPCLQKDFLGPLSCLRYDFPLLGSRRYISALATTLPFLFSLNLFQYSIMICLKVK